MNTKRKAGKGRDHLEMIKNMPCGVCCKRAPSAAHHIREGQGMAQKADDMLAIPLCYQCHQGDSGIHGDRALWKVFKKTELGVLAQTFKVLMYG